MNELMHWLRGFVPPPILAPWRERLLAGAGAAVGLLVTAWFSRLVLADISPWFIAPMGASAVLLFAVPASPLAQPWAIIGGNIVSALVGITCMQLIPDASAAAAIAVALAIGAMFLLRCLHPPAGAVAITAIFGGPSVAALGYGFALVPVAINSVLLVIAGLVFNNLSRHHRYPHRTQPQGNRHGTADAPPADRLGFTRADLRAAIKDYNELLDVSEDDLEEIFHNVELRAFRSRSSATLCHDIMSRDVVVASPAMTLTQAWRLLDKHKLRALPVVDERHALVGVITLRDLLAHTNDDAPRFCPKTLVSDRMSREVQFARPEQDIADLVSMFSAKRFHYLPVVDNVNHVVGMITQTDVIVALFRDQLDKGHGHNARLA